MSHRMFVAVVPPPEVVEDLSDFLEPRRDQGIPWIDPAQWHVTLAFMEAVPERRVDDLVARLDEAGAKRRPFTLRLGGVGAFPDPIEARVLWLGLRNGAGVAQTGELERLAVNVRAAASSAGAPVDGTPFRPHLSLARLKRPVEATRWLRILDTYTSSAWEVDSVDLVSSHLREGQHRRPRHEVVHTVSIGGDVPDPG